MDELNQGYLTPEEREILGDNPQTAAQQNNPPAVGGVPAEKPADSSEWLPNSNVYVNGREVHGKQKNIVTIGAIGVFALVIIIFAVVFGILAASKMT